MKGSPIINNPVYDSQPLDKRSQELRGIIIHTVESIRRGHIGSAFSLVEILRVLYDDILNYDPKNPRWKDRDRCILSKGHGCLALYAILADKGFFSKSELQQFCQHDGILGGHPEYGKVPGIEASTGSLGHGLSIGIGFALNALYEKASHRIFIVMGDGEINEGSVWEGAMCAGKHHLSNLTVLIDYNKQQSYASTFEVQNLEPLADKWTSFGFKVAEVDGHNVEELRTLLQRVPLDKNKPTAIICHTIKGKGVNFVEANLSWHHKNKIDDREIQSLYTALGVNK